MTRTGNKAWLVKRLAWRLQALTEGDLSARARRRAADLAQDADLRLSPPRHHQGARLPGAALLRRLHCGACGCPMSSSQTTKGTRRYRYYVCRQAHKRGWQTCPAPSLPAGPIEALVVEQVTKLAPPGAVDTFLAVWEALPLAEQARVLERLVK